VQSWNYEEVKHEAERRIGQLMAASIGKPEAEAQRLRQMAHGVYILWDGLTLGQRTENDSYQMQRLLGPYQFLWRDELGLRADD